MGAGIFDMKKHMLAEFWVSTGPPHGFQQDMWGAENPMGYMIILYVLGSRLPLFSIAMVGIGHQPNSGGVYIPIIRIPVIKGGMTIPTMSLDPGTYVALAARYQDSPL